jgi:dienelactone hydrolase
MLMLSTCWFSLMVISWNADPIVRGIVDPVVRMHEESIPAMYRLDSKEFPFEREPDLGGNGLTREKVRFPSPLVSKHPENNTVHAELFRPARAGKYPCVIVLHIAGGDFPLARFMAASLAHRGVAGLFIKLPYYGERRPARSKARLISDDLERGISGMRQAVLDIRRACDWAQHQPDLDPKRLGVMGVSLGAIVGGLASAIEPRLTHACLIMGAAELEHILYESNERKAKELLKVWEAWGGSRALLGSILRPVDAAAYGDRLKNRIVLQFTAADDEVIPRVCAVALDKATGHQRNVWYPCGHYTMVRYLPWVLLESTDFFHQWPSEKLPLTSPLPPAHPERNRH